MFQLILAYKKVCEGEKPQKYVYSSAFFSTFVLLLSDIIIFNKSLTSPSFQKKKKMSQVFWGEIKDSKKLVKSFKKSYFY